MHRAHREMRENMLSFDDGQEQTMFCVQHCEGQNCVRIPGQRCGEQPCAMIHNDFIDSDDDPYN